MGCSSSSTAVLRCSTQAGGWRTQCEGVAHAVRDCQPVPIQKRGAQQTREGVGARSASLHACKPAPIQRGAARQTRERSARGGGSHCSAPVVGKVERRLRQAALLLHRQLGGRLVGGEGVHAHQLQVAEQQVLGQLDLDLEGQRVEDGALREDDGLHDVVLLQLAVLRESRQQGSVVACAWAVRACLRQQGQLA